MRVVGSGSVPAQVSYREPAASSMGGSGISGSTVADPIDIQASQVPKGLNVRSEPKPPQFIPSVPIKVGVATPRVDISGSTAMDVEPVVVDVPMVPVVSEGGAPAAMSAAPPVQGVFLIPEATPAAPLATPASEAFLAPESPEAAEMEVDTSGSTAMEVEPLMSVIPDMPASSSHASVNQAELILGSASVSSA